MVPAIEQSSPVSWKHINLHGKFDFSDNTLKRCCRFNSSSRGARCLPSGRQTANEGWAFYEKLIFITLGRYMTKLFIL